MSTLAGIGRNPNVAAAVVICIEPKWADLIVNKIAETGKPVAAFSIERSGDLKTIEAAARKAKEFVQYATELQREPFGVKQLCMSTKCGESDTTSGLAANPTVGRSFERLLAGGATLMFGETTELTGGEDIVASRCIKHAERAQVPGHVRRLPASSSRARAWTCSVRSRPRATSAAG